MHHCVSEAPLRCKPDQHKLPVTASPDSTAEEHAQFSFAHCAFLPPDVHGAAPSTGYAGRLAFLLHSSQFQCAHGACREGQFSVLDAEPEMSAPTRPSSPAAADSDAVDLSQLHNNTVGVGTPTADIEDWRARLERLWQ